MTSFVRVPPEMDEADGSHPILIPVGTGWTPNGLDLPESLTLAAWERIGRDLSRVERSVMWCIGDWIAFGERKFGTYEEISKLLNLPYTLGTLRNAKYVATTYPASSRNDRLSFAHHAQAASLPTEERAQMLRQASDNGWKVRELREEIQRRKAADIVRAEVDPESPFGYALRCLARLVAAVFDIDPASFVGETKGSPIQVHARQVLMYLLMTEAGFQEMEIAQGLGRHHSTVGHAVANFTALREEADIDLAFTRLGEMYRSLREARDKVPALVEALAP